jgi:hypothetical protein
LASDPIYFSFYHTSLRTGVPPVPVITDANTSLTVAEHAQSRRFRAPAQAENQDGLAGQT